MSKSFDFRSDIFGGLVSDDTGGAGSMDAKSLITGVSVTASQSIGHHTFA